MIAEKSATGGGLIGDQSPTQISLRPIGDQSPTSRRPTADWFQCHMLSDMTYSIRSVCPFASKDPGYQSSRRLVADRFT